MQAFKLPEVVLPINLSTKQNTGCKPLHLAAKLNRTDLLEGLIFHLQSHNTNIVDSLDRNGETALLSAVKVGNTASCKILLLSGADPNFSDKVTRSQTFRSRSLE